MLARNKNHSEITQNKKNLFKKNDLGPISKEYHGLGPISKEYEGYCLELQSLVKTGGGARYKQFYVNTVKTSLKNPPEGAISLNFFSEQSRKKAHSLSGDFHEVL